MRDERGEMVRQLVLLFAKYTLAFNTQRTERTQRKLDNMLPIIVCVSLMVLSYYHCIFIGIY